MARGIVAVAPFFLDILQIGAHLGAFDKADPDPDPDPDPEFSPAIERLVGLLQHDDGQCCQSLLRTGLGRGALP